MKCRGNLSLQHQNQGSDNPANIQIFEGLVILKLRVFLGCF